MKLYAVRDRLIDYFMTPFVAPSDKQVLASLAELINGENAHAITQAPHHFEIWRIANLSEDGRIEEAREFLADAASLIRPGVRANAQTRGAEANPEPAGSEISHSRTPGDYSGRTGPGERPAGLQAPPASQVPPEIPRAAGRGRGLPD